MGYAIFIQTSTNGEWSDEMRTAYNNAVPIEDQGKNGDYVYMSYGSDLQELFRDFLLAATKASVDVTITPFYANDSDEVTNDDAISEEAPIECTDG